MRYSVATSITPRAAAKMLISNEIDISSDIPYSEALKILDELRTLTVEECLSIVDFNNYGTVADIKHIPQFSKIEKLFRVPLYFIESGQMSVDYPQLGFYLKLDINASLVSNIKYGENHGKTTAILGLIDCNNTRFIPSAFTSAFCSFDEDKQREIMLRLFFRVPVVQIILKAAAVDKVNGFLPMMALKESTRLRRSYSIRAIFKQLLLYDHSELNHRIENIVWEDN